MYRHGKLSKVTTSQKFTFKNLSQANLYSIFIETQAIANHRESRPYDTRTAYPNWQLGKVVIAMKHGIHRNHVNAIIRQFSGKSSSSRISQQLPPPPYY